jgi:hypothetical protein
MIIRSLTKDEIALFRAGLKLLVIQGQKNTRQAAQAALDQQMPENLLWKTGE